MSKEEYWSKTHEAGYDVFSLTQDQGLRDRVVAEVVVAIAAQLDGRLLAPRLLFSQHFERFSQE